MKNHVSFARIPIKFFGTVMAVQANSKMPVLRDFLHRTGREARQGAIGLVIDDDYLEIGFPLEEVPAPRQPKGKKRR